jgi:poly-gamma-glutamate capsule biosynthesis protein CapA/YwtB (metallophosphatase superfamily)
LKIEFKHFILALLGISLPTLIFICLFVQGTKPSQVLPMRAQVIKVQLPQGGTAPVTIAIAGDTMLGDAGSRTIASKGFDYPFERVAPLMKDADFAIVNAEAPITRHKKVISRFKSYIYKSRPRVLAAFMEAGIDGVTIANNHVFDYCREGYEDFLRRMDRAELNYFGGGRNEAQARRAMVLDFGSVRVAFLNYMDNYGYYNILFKVFADEDRSGIAMLTEHNLTADIAAAHEEADLVVVIIHAGKNYKPITRIQERYARYAIDAGADVVIGHHPHIFQAVELYRGKPILYSLGNFVFNTPGRDWFRYGMVARLLIENKKIDRIELLPIITQNRIVKFRPRPATGRKLTKFFKKLIPASAKRGAKIERHGNIGVLKLSEVAAPSE